MSDLNESQVLGASVEEWNQIAHQLARHIHHDMCHAGDMRVMDCEDYANEALLRFLRAEEKGLVPGDRAQSYLASIIRNSIIDDQRRHQRPTTLDPTSDATADVFGTASGGREVSDSEDAIEILDNVSQRLSGRKKLLYDFFLHNRDEFDIDSAEDCRRAARFLRQNDEAARKLLQRLWRDISEMRTRAVLEKRAPCTPSPPPRVDWEDCFDFEHLFRDFSSLAGKSPRFLKQPRTSDDYLRLFWLDIVFGFSAGEALRQPSIQPSTAVEVLVITTERFQDAVFLARMLNNDALVAYGLLQWVRFLALVFHLGGRGELPFPLPTDAAGEVIESALSTIFPKARRVLRRNDLSDPIVARCAGRTFELYRAFSTRSFASLPYVEKPSPIPGDILVRAARRSTRDDPKAARAERNQTDSDSQQ